MPDHVSEINLIQNILKDMGIVLPRNAKILDFGCGSGAAVYAYLDQGYDNVYGYDVENYLSLKNKNDANRFFFSFEKMLPHQGSFDFIFSNQVFEHVMDYPQTIQLIYNLLKPGGVCLHLFPSKWRFIEPHIYVPLAGVFHTKPYLGFWAKMGIRNEFQQGKHWKEVRNQNVEFCREKVNYLSTNMIRNYFQKYFERVEFKEGLFIKHSPGRLRYFSKFLKAFPGLDIGLRLFHSHTVFTQKYDQGS